MKRKFTISMIAIMLVAVLTGCSIDPRTWFKKGGDTVPSDAVDTPIEETRIMINDSTPMEYEVGTTILVTDMYLCAQEYASSISQSAFMLSDGSITDSYEVQEGEQVVTVVVQFADGLSNALDITIMGIAPTFAGDPEAKEMVDNASYTVYLNNMTAISEYQDGLECAEAVYFENVDDYTFATGSVAGADSIKITEDDTTITLYPVDKMRTTARVVNQLAGLTESMDMFELMGAEGIPMRNMMQLLIDVAKEGTVEPISNILYSLSGEQAELYVSTLVCDMSSITGTEGDTVALPYEYYIKLLDSNEIYAIAIYEMYSVPFVVDMLESSGINGESELLQQDYDKFVEAVKESYVHDPSIVDKYSYILDMMKQHILIGTDMDNTISEPEEPMDSDFAVDASTEEPIINENTNDTIAYVKPLYSELYPDIYTWPASEIKYRRYSYSIDDDTTYNSVIIYPDGTARESGKEDVTEITNGLNGNSYVAANKQTFSLVSPYSTFKISNENNSSASFDTAKSTTSKLELTYLGEKYKIITATSADIQNYQKTCLYDTSNMRDGSFVVEVDTPSSKTTDYGRITPYTITYIDKNTNASVTLGYMAVYNISNDYLVIYGDNVPFNTILMNILETLVTVGE